MNQESNQEPKFHWLIAGQVVLTDGDNPELNTVFLNGVITTKEILVGAHDIGRAQQTLQMLFFKKMPPEAHSSIKIVDVVIMSISNLGFMTDDRFLQKPEGLEVKERAKPILSVVKSNDVVADPEAKTLN